MRLRVSPKPRGRLLGGFVSLWHASVQVLVPLFRFPPALAFDFIESVRCTTPFSLLLAVSPRSRRGLRARRRRRLQIQPNT